MRVLRVNESVLALALEYLGLKELVAFDSAVTNPGGRGHYLTGLSRVDVTKALDRTRENSWGENLRWRRAYRGLYKLQQLHLMGGRQITNQGLVHIAALGQLKLLERIGLPPRCWESSSDSAQAGRQR